MNTEEEKKKDYGFKQWSKENKKIIAFNLIFYFIFVIVLILEDIYSGGRSSTIIGLLIFTFFIITVLLGTYFRGIDKEEYFEIALFVFILSSIILIVIYVIILIFER